MSVSVASLSGWWYSSVSITPGNTTWTRTPVPCRSTASDSVHVVSAPFDAAYAVSRGGLRRAAMDETFTIRPSFRSSIDGSNASVSLIGDEKLMAITSSTTSGVRSRT